jgi:hypothetical protein
MLTKTLRAALDRVGRLTRRTCELVLFSGFIAAVLVVGAILVGLVSVTGRLCVLRSISTQNYPSRALGQTNPSLHR